MKTPIWLIVSFLSLGCPVWAQVIPFVDSTVYDPATDLVKVSYGYTSTNLTPLIIAIGPNNLLSPPPSNQGQPTTFQPGTFHNVFTTTFSLQATTTQRWLLEGSSAVASANGIFDAPVTYQGSLSVSGQAVTGLADFQFILYDAATNGNEIYGSGRLFDPTYPTNTAATGGPVMVSNGLFTVVIPWESSQLAGGTRWLAIQTRYPSGVSNYVTLWPRQQLTSAPFAANAQLLGGLPASNYALAGANASQTISASLFLGNGAGLTSLNAANLAGTIPDTSLSANVPLLNASQQFTGANVFASSVGIGVNNPGAMLQVDSSASGLVLASSTSPSGTWLGLRNSSSGGSDWQMVSTGSGNSEGVGKLLFIEASGFVSGGSEPLILTSSGATVNGTFNNNSDRNAKQDFTGVNPDAILDEISRLPLSQWSYKADPATRHIGPMAQDFYSAFKVGTDDRHIAPIDEGGVALAAIQSLDQKLQAKNAEIEQLKQQNDSLSQRVTDLEAAVKALSAGK